MALLHFMHNVLGLEARWYLFLTHASSVFGLLVYTIRYELRLARKQLWRKLPLVVGFGVLALFHGVVLGSVVYAYGPEWRMWEYTFLTIMEIALFYAALYPIYEYCTLPSPAAFNGVLEGPF